MAMPQNRCQITPSPSPCLEEMKEWQNPLRFGFGIYLYRELRDSRPRTYLFCDSMGMGLNAELVVTW